MSSEIKVAGHPDRGSALIDRLSRCLPRMLAQSERQYQDWLECAANAHRRDTAREAAS
jgi:hypothetical protein